MSMQGSALQVLHTLLPLVPAKEKRRFIGLLGLSLLMAVSELALTGLVALLAAIFGSPEAVLNSNPVLWLRETSGVSFGNDPRLLALSALCGVFLLVAGKNVLNVTQQSQNVAFSETVSAAARTRLFRFFQRAPFLWIVHNGVAELNFGLNSANNIAYTLNVFLQVFSSGLMLLTLFIGLVGVSPVPSLTFIVVLGLGGLLVVKASRGLLVRCSRGVYTADYRVSQITHLALHGLKEMRLYGREDLLFSAYAKKLGEVAKARTRRQTAAHLPVACLETLGFATLVMVMLFLIFFQDAGMARISGVMGFMAAAAWRGLPVANRLVDAVAAMRADLPYLRKVVELVTLERTLADNLLPLDTNPEPVSFERDVVLDNISFRYPKAAAAAVSGVSMTIKAGKMVGLVGLSGAGKSTLVNLLTGLVPPESGRLLVDGVPIAKNNAGSWLRQIGYVAQAPYILDASLAENVALSRWGEALDRERVLECCRMAALDFVDELEQGIDTVLGDRGTRLSGGQAQRVAIARAFYSEPALIIFDEATSSLDMRNETAIHETILSLRRWVTMVVIAHRLSTVEACDIIVWMERGRVHREGAVGEVLPEYRKALRSRKTATPADDDAGTPQGRHV
jgi:ABC-type multidrug transport system fused ATPase/permease subunit